MSLLGGGVASLFANLLAPLYLPAVLTSVTETHVRGKLRRATSERTCRAQVDACTERMVGTEGYTDTDRAVFILAGTLAGNAVTGQEIEVQEGPYAGAVYRLASPITRDPGGAYWLARGVEVKSSGG